MIKKKFLGIYIEIHCHKIHMEQITHKLSAAYYAVRFVKLFMSQEMVKVVYYAYYSHSINNCRLVFWQNSSHSLNT
jgi:hypothetical protein